MAGFNFKGCLKVQSCAEEQTRPLTLGGRFSTCEVVRLFEGSDFKFCVTVVITSTEEHTRPQLFSVKSRQMPRTSGGTKSARPVNSLVKKVWPSFGSDAIALRSSRGAQATPTENMVMPGGLKEMQVSEGANTNCVVSLFEHTPCFCAAAAGRMTSSYDWPSVTTMRKLRPGPVRLVEKMYMNRTVSDLQTNFSLSSYFSSRLR